MSDSWYGPGKTLRESVVGQSLLSSFEELDIGVNRKDPKPQRLANANSQKTDDGTPQEDPAAKRSRRGQRGDGDGAPAPVPELDLPDAADEDGEEDAEVQPERPNVFEEALQNVELKEAKEKLVAQRRAAIRAARQEIDVSKFIESDIYYALLMQGEHATRISLRERESFKTKGGEGETVMVPSSVVPSNVPTYGENGEVQKDVAGKTVYVPPSAKRDIELSLPVNRCMAKRMLYPKEPVAVGQLPDGPKESLTTSHSQVNLNFVVFSDENKAKAGRPSTFPFKFGEGTEEIPPDIAGDPNAVLKFRRANLFRYGSGGGDPSDSQYEENFMELSSKAMHLQDRKLGYPLFSGSDFVENTKYTAFDGRPLERNDKALPKVDDPVNMKRFHRAMRYKFEVMRLWWKLFCNQQKRIYFSILKEGGLQIDLRKMRDMTPPGWEDLYDESAPRMVLAVVERGREGALFPGNIYPRFDEGDIRDDKRLFVKRKVQNDEFEQLGGSESELVQPVQRVECQLWPLVTPARTGSWLAWTTEIELRDERGMPYKKPGTIVKNEEAWTILNTTFGIDNERVDIDYDDMWANPPEDFRNYVIDLFDSDRSSEDENKMFAFEKMSQVADDMIDSMPFWAHAYLCEALVKKEPEDVAVVTEKKTSLQKEISDLNVEIRVEKQVYDGDMMKGASKEAREALEANIFLMEVELARKVDQLKAITDDYATANVMWAPYASNLTTLRERNDSSARFALTWAQEQLQRCVMNVWKSNQKVYSSEVVSGFPPPLDDMGHPVVEGTDFAADYFRQWFYEVYLGRGENGIGMNDQLVVMTNLIDAGKPVLTSLPGAVQLQGHRARILSKKPKPMRAGERNVVDRYLYTLETDFLSTETDVVQLGKLKAQNKVSKVNTVVVELSGAHIWPLCYNSRWRYGDIVEYRPIESGGSVSQAKADANNRLWRGSKELPQPWQWVVVERPYYAPPEEFTNMGWGTYSLADTSFKQAPPDAKERTSTIGQIVISRHMRDSQVGKDDYMRFPLPVNSEGNYILGPLSKGVAVPDGSPIATLKSTRVNSASKTVKQAQREGRLEFVSNKAEEEKLKKQERERKKREAREAEGGEATLQVSDPTREEIEEALREAERGAPSRSMEE